MTQNDAMARRESQKFKTVLSSIGTVILKVCEGPESVREKLKGLWRVNVCVGMCTFIHTYIHTYEGCPKMPYNCIVSLKFNNSISLIHMHPVGNLFLDILLKLHKIS